MTKIAIVLVDYLINKCSRKTKILVKEFFTHLNFKITNFIIEEARVTCDLHACKKITFRNCTLHALPQCNLNNLYLQSFGVGYGSLISKIEMSVRSCG